MTTSNTSKKFNIPSVMIIFGITGDLVKKKILKALYHLYVKKHISGSLRVYGFSRREMNTESMRKYLLNIMQESSFPNPDFYLSFLNSFFYIKGDFTEKEAYKNLAKNLGNVDGEWQVCSNKLFYLAVPPQSYEAIITNLHSSGLTKPCGDEEGWTRVILEKPFGTDLKTAQELDRQLGALFKEEQIYRVDHYLAKETVRNIMAFRFSNIFFKPIWNNKYIEKIEVKLFQQEGVDGRGDFYDEVGALRDVGQNHLLQLLSLFIMEEPSEFSSISIKKERAKALASLVKLEGDEVLANTQRAQSASYKKVKGIKKGSQTETYFKIKAFSNNKAFHGVPLIIESGKYQNKALTEVVVTFKPSDTPFSSKANNSQNRLIYQILPQEKISMCFLSKKPGYDYELKSHELGFNYRQAYLNEQFVDDYEALLYDIFRGDQMLFVSTSEIMNEWAFIEPIITVWKDMNLPKLDIY